MFYTSKPIQAFAYGKDDMPNWFLDRCENPQPQPGSAFLATGKVNAHPEFAYVGTGSVPSTRKANIGDYITLNGRGELNVMRAETFKALYQG